MILYNLQTFYIKILYYGEIKIYQFLLFRKQRINKRNVNIKPLLLWKKYQSIEVIRYHRGKKYTFCYNVIVGNHPFQELLMTISCIKVETFSKVLDKTMQYFAVK